jgi:hypothetical protein
MYAQAREWVPRVDGVRIDNVGEVPARPLVVERGHAYALLHAELGRREIDHDPGVFGDPVFAVTIWTAVAAGASSSEAPESRITGGIIALDVSQERERSAQAHARRAPSVLTDVAPWTLRESSRRGFKVHAARVRRTVRSRVTGADRPSSGGAALASRSVGPEQLEFARYLAWKTRHSPGAAKLLDVQSQAMSAWLDGRI